MEKKPTFGSVINAHRAQNHTLEDDVIEYRRAMEPSIMRRIHDEVNKVKTHPLYLNKDFYVMLLMKIEPMSQQPQTIIVARRSCPSAWYKQSVWKYHAVSGELEFLWTIPDQILYWHIWHNRDKYLQDPETKQLAQFVVLMETGQLEKWIVTENGEKPDAIIKIQNEEQFDG